MAKQDRGGHYFAGLIMVVLGLYFLFHAYLPDIKLWPLILIVVGVYIMITGRKKRSEE
jgi:hypothetical protein